MPCLRFIHCWAQLIMITQEQIDNLKAGDKLIFFCNGGVLSANTGNVFTFANWWNEDDKWHPGKHYCQCKELHNQGNHEHNFSIYHTELFDENIHKDFVLMDEKKLVSQQREFIDKYGA